MSAEAPAHQVGHVALDGGPGGPVGGLPGGVAWSARAVAQCPRGDRRRRSSPWVTWCRTPPGDRARSWPSPTDPGEPDGDGVPGGAGSHVRLVSIEKRSLVWPPALGAGGTPDHDRRAQGRQGRPGGSIPVGGVPHDPGGSSAPAWAETNPALAPRRQRWPGWPPPPRYVPSLRSTLGVPCSPQKRQRFDSWRCLGFGSTAETDPVRGHPLLIRKTPRLPPPRCPGRRPRRGDRVPRPPSERGPRPPRR